MKNGNAMSGTERRLANAVVPDEIERLLCALIALESHEQVPGREAQVTAYMRDYFARHDIPVELLPVAGERCNLVARLDGETDGPVLVFNGHSDTVPPYDMKSPFVARIEGDRIYGRGSADMKGALAAMISVLVALKRSNVRRKGSIVFAATVGEEEYSPGAFSLVTGGFRATHAIVGENTELQVATAHKGVMWAEAVFEGKAVHGSVPDKGVNAIYHASRWIEKVRTEYIPTLRQRSHPLLGIPSINIGMIEGGTRPVTVPHHCSIRFDRRMVPGEDRGTAMRELQQLTDELAQTDPEFKGRVAEMPVFHDVPHPPLESDPNSQLASVLRNAYKEEFGQTMEPCGLSYWTDGALLARIPGIQVVVCGPGNIEQAHSNEEWISREQIHAAYRMYLRAAARLCLPKE